MCALLLFALTANFDVQQVEEGILDNNVPGVLHKSVKDLLDLTDLVRGKLNAQVYTTNSDVICICTG